MSTTTETNLAPETDPEFKAARERAEQLQGLAIHVLCYVVVIAGLFLIDVLTGSGWWFYWVALPWGIGLAVHALAVLSPVFSPDWADRRARRELESRRR